MKKSKKYFIFAIVSTFQICTSIQLLAGGSDLKDDSYSSTIFPSKPATLFTVTLEWFFIVSAQARIFLGSRSLSTVMIISARVSGLTPSGNKVSL